MWGKGSRLSMPASPLLWTLKRFCRVLVADDVKSFDTVDRSILDSKLGRLGFLGVVSAGLFSRSAWSSLSRFASRGVSVLSALSILGRSCMRIISNAARIPLSPFWTLPSSRFCMFRRRVRTSLPVNVSCSSTAGFGQSFSPLGMTHNHLQSAIFEAWQLFACRSVRVSRCPVSGCAGFSATTYGFPSEGKRKMLLRAVLCGRVWNGFLLGKSGGGCRVSVLWC